MTARSVTMPMGYEWDHDCKALIRPQERQHEIVQSRGMYLAPKNFSQDQAPDHFWLQCFQDTLHLALDWYLNGTGLQIGDRLSLRPMRHPYGRLAELLERAWHLANQKLEVASSPQSRPSQEFDTPTQLVALHQILDQQLSSAKVSNSPITVQPSPTCQGNPPPEVAKIRRYSAKILSELECDLFVQGSVATGEQIGYSDLDLWMMISRKTLANPDHLQALARLVFRIQRSLYHFDPLQHHGVMLATQIDLQCYPEAYLPVDALKKACDLFPEPSDGLILRPRSSAIDSGMAFFNLLAMFRKTVQEQTHYAQAFNVKSMLSHVMLLPALFEGAQGKPCYKADSFERVQKCVPAELWSLMEEVSAVREQWQYRPSRLRRGAQKLLRNPFLFQYMMRRGLSGRLEQTVGCQLPKDWQARSLALAEKLWEKLCS